MRDKTAGEAIIRQLVCGWYCYLMLMPPDPIDTCVYATERRTDSCYETERSPPWTRTRPLLSATPANTGVVHEEADSGMPRVLIRCTVRVRSNLSGVYHRRASSHEGARRRGRMNVEQRRRGKKSLYRATGLVDQPREPAAEKLRDPPVLLPRLAEFICAWLRRDSQTIVFRYFHQWKVSTFLRFGFQLYE